MLLGDLVVDEGRYPEDSETGIVILIDTGVEIPPMIKVLWSSGVISTSSADDLKVVSKVR